MICLAKNIILIGITLWVVVFTVSYGLYEFRPGSKKAAGGVFVLSLVLCLLFIKI